MAVTFVCLGVMLNYITDQYIGAILVSQRWKKQFSNFTKTHGMGKMKVNSNSDNLRVKI